MSKSCEGLCGSKFVELQVVQSSILVKVDLSMVYIECDSHERFDSGKKAYTECVGVR